MSTKSTKHYFTFAATLVSVIGVGFFVIISLLDNRSKQAVDERIESEVPEYVQISTGEGSSFSLTQMNPRDQALTILNLWYELEDDANTQGIQVASDIDSVQKIAIRQDVFAVIKSGYKVQLPHFIGDRYLLKIDRVIKVSDEETQIFAEMEEDNVSYFSTLSVINKKILALLSTPKGDYNLKMVDGVGIIYKSADMTSGSLSEIDQPSFIE